jgi:hypothetical protein
MESEKNIKIIGFLCIETHRSFSSKRNGLVILVFYERNLRTLPPNYEPMKLA